MIKAIFGFALGLALVPMIAVAAPSGFRQIIDDNDSTLKKEGVFVMPDGPGCMWIMHDRFSSSGAHSYSALAYSPNPCP